MGIKDHLRKNRPKQYRFKTGQYAGMTFDEVAEENKGLWWLDGLLGMLEETGKKDTILYKELSAYMSRGTILERIQRLLDHYDDWDYSPSQEVVFKVLKQMGVED